MGMSWARIDHGIFRSPKYTVLRKAGQWRAMVGGVYGNLYANEHTTDGFLAEDVIDELWQRDRELEHLVGVGLWVPVGGGFQISGFDERQTVGNTSAKGQLAAAVRWSCSKGHHVPQCRMTGCECSCHLGRLVSASA